MSWEKITYLKDWPEEAGSPFDYGVKDNLEYFCCTHSEKLREWKIPRF